VVCSATNVRDWAYWEKELEHWSTEDLLQSEHAGEFVHMLQTRPGWQRISAAAERCYQAGATQVLLCGPSVQDPDHARDIVPDTVIDDCGIETAIFVDSGIDLAVSGLNAREIRRVVENVSALFGERVDVIPFYLDEQRQSQHEKNWLQGKASRDAEWQEDMARVTADLGWDFQDFASESCHRETDARGPGVDGSPDQDLLSGSLWISRCGVVRPARSFASLFSEIGLCEEARGNEPRGKA